MGCARIVVSDLRKQLDAFFVAVEVNFEIWHGKKAKGLTWQFSPFSKICNGYGEN